jgi:hypothetical protein
VLIFNYMTEQVAPDLPKTSGPPGGDIFADYEAAQGPPMMRMILI